MKIINNLLERIMPYRILYESATLEREKIVFPVQKINLRFFTAKAQEKEMKKLQEKNIITPFYYTEGKTNMVDKVLDSYIIQINALFC